MSRSFCLLVVGLYGWLGAPNGLRAAQSFLVYVSNERSGNISVIDGRSDSVVATFEIGKRPRGIHCSPDGRLVYIALSGSPRIGPGVDRSHALVSDRSADGIAVVDTPSQIILRKLEVGSDPEQFAISRDGTWICVANEDAATASIFELPTGKVRAQIAVGNEPEGVAINPISGQIYVTCEEAGQIFVIDPGLGKSIAHFQVGGRPRSVAFLPDGSKAFVPAESEALVSEVNALTHEVTATIPIGPATMPMMVLMAPNGKELYVSTGRGNSVAVVDLGENRVVSNIEAGGRVWGLALSPDGSKLYTANGATNDISVIDVESRCEVTRIKVGDGPWGIAIGPDLWNRDPLDPASQ